MEPHCQRLGCADAVGASRASAAYAILKVTALDEARRHSAEHTEGDGGERADRHNLSNFTTRSFVKFYSAIFFQF